MNLSASTSSGLRAAAFVALVTAAPSARADTVTLAPSHDNSLYAELPGNSNGAGQNIFSGTNSSTNPRRCLIAFDVAGSVPAGATITSATLILNLSQSQAPTTVIGLHRVLASWGEGTSDAPGAEGQGTAATTGDATWSHRFFNTVTWTTAGGDYDATASATTSVSDVLGAYTWASTAGLVADVQAWLDTPAIDQGWILIADESIPATAKRFDSRQNPTVANRPRLVVDYEPGSLYCNASDGAQALCPCANPGAPDAGCDNPAATGGVRLAVSGFAPDGLGGGTATVVATGFPPTTQPTFVVVRGIAPESPPTVFGDGLTCVAALGQLRIGSGTAAAGTSSLPISHGAGSGVFYYQIWYRSTPGAFCTPYAYNLSNGYTLTW